jgi:hypothetical protein
VSDSTYLTAEARARVGIDRQLVQCGWVVQDRKAMNLYAAQGVAVREFIMATGHGSGPARRIAAHPGGGDQPGRRIDDSQ